MLHDNLLHYRKALRLSQEEMAERVGVSRQAYAKWESGDTVPELKYCTVLSSLFGITLDELVRGTAQPGEPEKGKEPAAVVIERRGMETHRIIALAVLCAGLFLSVLLLVLTGPRTALLLGLPLMAAGALFLALPRRHLLWGFWVLWLLAAVGLYILTGGWLISFALGSAVGKAVLLPMMAAFIALIVATVRRLKK